MPKRVGASARQGPKPKRGAVPAKQTRSRVPPTNPSDRLQTFKASPAKSPPGGSRSSPGPFRNNAALDPSAVRRVVDRPPAPAARSNVKPANTGKAAQVQRKATPRVPHRR